MVLVHEEVDFDGADHHSPTVDEALLAAESAQVVHNAMARLPEQWTCVRHPFPPPTRPGQGSTTSPPGPAGNTLTSMSTRGQDDGGMRVYQSGGI